MFGMIKKNIKKKWYITGRYVYESRKKNNKKLLLLLAGYKTFLYPEVIGRLERYLCDNIDVCIVSSGLYDKVLSEYAKKNSWSYLSTERNCVSLAQNIAIKLHPNAEFIYKMDEDIFLTENTFEILMDTYKKVEADGRYNVGFVAPLIPINGYGHTRILVKLGLEDTYENRFEKIKVAAGQERMVENNPEVARFFWGAGGIVPSIDTLNKKFQHEPLNYSVCPIRFSIGFILFHRNTWLDMGMLRVPLWGSAMGEDEVQICSCAMRQSKAIIVAENTVVGHLSFGKQNEQMKKYFLEHREVFAVKQVNE